MDGMTPKRRRSLPGPPKRLPARMPMRGAPMARSMPAAMLGAGMQGSPPPPPARPIEADLSGPGYQHLGHFTAPEIVHEGHNRVLSAAARSKLPSSKFAVPSKAPGPGSYPIPDAAHARNALARASQFGSPAVQAAVRRKVAAKFPGIGHGGHGR